MGTLKASAINSLRKPDPFASAKIHQGADVSHMKSFMDLADVFIKNAFGEGVNSAMLGQYKSKPGIPGKLSVKEGDDLLKTSLKNTVAHGIAALRYYASSKTDKSETPGEGGISNLDPNTIKSAELKALKREMKNAYILTAFQELKNGAITNLTNKPYSDKEITELLVSMNRDMESQSMGNMKALLDFVERIQSGAVFSSQKGGTFAAAPVTRHMSDIINDVDASIDVMTDAAYAAFLDFSRDSTLLSGKTTIGGSSARDLLVNYFEQDTMKKAKK